MHGACDNFDQHHSALWYADTFEDLAAIVIRGCSLQGLQSYKQLVGSLPTAVVYSSILWDAARLYYYDPEAQAGMSLPPEMLTAWADHFRGLLRAVQVGSCSP